MLETLISLDILALESIRTAFHVDSDWFHTLIFILADSEWIFIAVFLVILWLIGTKKNDTSYKVQSLNIFYMIVGGFILYIILNQFLPVRPRPETVSHIPPLLHHLPDNSFPSGHAIFAAASWLGVRIFTGSLRLSIFVLILGIVMNLARIVAGIHYPGDILVGYLVGFIGAAIIYFLHRKALFRKWLTPFFLKLASYLRL